MFLNRMSVIRLGGGQYQLTERIKRVQNLIYVEFVELNEGGYLARRFRCVIFLTLLNGQ